MADAYVRPILDAIETILIDNFNTRINDISTSSYLDWKTTSFSPYIIPQPVDLPWVNAFQFGDSVHDSIETGGGFDANWQIATIIDMNGKDENQLNENLDILMTALIRCLTRGSTGNVWTFNQTVDGVVLTRSGLEPLDEDENGNLFGAAFAIWEGVRTYDPTAE